MRALREFGILGCGNLATAIVESFAQESKEVHFHCYTPTLIRAQKLAEKIRGVASSDVDDFKKLDVYLLACKPQQFHQLANSFKNIIPRDALVISVMASIDVDTIKGSLGIENVVRLMPNTASLYKKGVTLFYADKNIGITNLNWSLDFAGSFSYAHEVTTEEELDRLTVFSGSGPAIFLEVLNQATKVLIEQGVAPELAEKIMRGTFVGTASLLYYSEKNIEVLKSEVTSKKGITAEALNTLGEDNKLNLLLAKTFKAGIKRTLELRDEIKKILG